MLKTVEKVLLMQDLDLFRWASTENLARLSLLAHEEEHPSGSLLFEHGDAASKLQLLVQGKVELQNAQRPAQVVEKTALDALSVFSQAPHAMSARCLEPCTFLVVSFDDLVDLLTAEPEFCWAIVRHLAHSGRELLTRVDEAALEPNEESPASP